jgi:hypothetical protein
VALLAGRVKGVGVWWVELTEADGKSGRVHMMAAPTLHHGTLQFRHVAVVLAVFDGGQGLEFDAIANVQSEGGGGANELLRQLLLGDGELLQLRRLSRTRAGLTKPPHVARSQALVVTYRRPHSKVKVGGGRPSTESHTVFASPTRASRSPLTESRGLRQSRLHRPPFDL